MFDLFSWAYSHIVDNALFVMPPSVGAQASLPDLRFEIGADSDGVAAVLLFLAPR